MWLHKWWAMLHTSVVYTFYFKRGRYIPPMNTLERWIGVSNFQFRSHLDASRYATIFLIENIESKENCVHTKKWFCSTCGISTFKAIIKKEKEIVQYKYFHYLFSNDYM